MATFHRNDEFATLGTGFPIGKGSREKAMADESDWSEELMARTFLRGVEHRAALASTNDRALEWLRREETEMPALVLADRQSAGRGRGSNRWWAGEGALTFSLILNDLHSEAVESPLPCDPRIALWTGIAVARALKPYCDRAALQLKWPNDVWLNGRKLGGILIEPPPGRPGVAVIGIGLNVNNSLLSAPQELRSSATSLRDATGQKLCRRELLVQILRDIERAFQERQTTDLQQTWNAFCALNGLPLVLNEEGESAAGMCRGIRSDGALLIETGQGMRAIYSATHIRLIAMETPRVD